MLDTINYIPKDKIERAVIFMHGYGSNGEDFSSLIYEYSRHLKNTAFYSPNAPKPTPFSFGNSFEWFPLDSYNPAVLKQNIDQMKFVFGEYVSLSESSRLEINALINFIKGKHDLKSDKISLMGFSQGGMMATLTSLLYKENLGPIVSFSGISPVISRDSNIKTKPKMLLIHGDMDTVVPIEAIDISKKLLANFDIIPEIHICKNMEHEINYEASKKAMDFLIKNFL